MPSVKHLPPKERMKEIAKLWKSQKGTGGSTKVAAQRSGSVKKLVGKRGKRKRIATVAEDEYGSDDEGGQGIMTAQRGGSALGVADMLEPANEIPISKSIDQSGMGGLHAVQHMQGGSAWGDFKYGFSLPFKALKVVAPIASLAL